MKIDTRFSITDHVSIDNDKSVKGIILGISIRGIGANVTYDVGWMNNGQSYSAWIEEWRLMIWEE